MYRVGYREFLGAPRLAEVSEHAAEDRRRRREEEGLLAHMIARRRRLPIGDAMEEARAVLYRVRAS